MRQELLRVRSRFNIPVILITHDPEDVAALAETVVVYASGKVTRVVPATQVDTPPIQAIKPLLPLPAGKPESEIIQ